RLEIVSHAGLDVGGFGRVGAPLVPVGGASVTGGLTLIPRRRHSVAHETCRHRRRRRAARRGRAGAGPRSPARGRDGPGARATVRRARQRGGPDGGPSRSGQDGTRRGAAAAGPLPDGSAVEGGPIVHVREGI